MMRDHVHRDDQLENREELLLDLRDSSALALSAYTEDDDSVTRVLQVTDFDAEWLVAVTQREQRAFTTEQLGWALARGELRPEMLVWRRGQPAWQLLGDVVDLPRAPVVAPAPRAVAPVPHVAVAPVPHVAAPEPRAAAPEPRAVAPVPHVAVAPVPAPRRASEARAIAPEPRVAVAPVPAPRRAAEAPPARPVEVCAPRAEERAASAAAPAEPAPLVPPDIELEHLMQESGSLRVKRAVMAVSALAMTGVFVVLFSISANSEDKVREAARQREAAEAVKVKATQRESAGPESASDETEEETPVRRRTPRERARGVPSQAAAMVMDSDELPSAETGSRVGASEEARQRL